MTRFSVKLDQASKPCNRYFGYMMVTVDPEMSEAVLTGSRSSRGSAYELAMSRLQKSRWVLYRGTRLKKEIGINSRLLFYIGGTKKNHHHVIASAVVGGIEPWTMRSPTIDSDEFSTDLPSEVLILQDVVFSAEPKSVKQLLPRLDLAPENTKYWGVVLQGGCTGLSKADWDLLAP